jgi:xylulokinase
MDSSTTLQCREISGTAGGQQNVQRITGSCMFERFTGPQIRKIYQMEPKVYLQTKYIHLVSSFLSSVLAGINMPIDTGDSAGMNLMDIKTFDWSVKMLDATAPGLKEKLPEISLATESCSFISSYFCKKYGFSKDTLVFPFTGDNPASLIGLGITEESKCAFSLGTSDTIFTYKKHYRAPENQEGHFFGAPGGGYMTLTCFKNGALAREKIREMYGMTWPKFSSALKNTPPGNNKKFMTALFDPEITPFTQASIVKYNYDHVNENSTVTVRAVIEGQIMSRKIHSEWTCEKINTIYATGGASENREILQVIADVFNCPVFFFEVSNSACLGAAYTACCGYLKKEKGMERTSVINRYVEQRKAASILPDPVAARIYKRIIRDYSDFEKLHISRF